MYFLCFAPQQRHTTICLKSSFYIFKLNFLGCWVAEGLSAFWECSKGNGRARGWSKGEPGAGASPALPAAAPRFESQHRKRRAGQRPGTGTGLGPGTGAGLGLGLGPGAERAAESTQQLRPPPRTPWRLHSIPARAEAPGALFK